MKKYGKSYKEVYKMKKNFTTENDEWLKENTRIAKIYAEGEIRTNC